MPKQSLRRIIKRWMRYVPRNEWKNKVPDNTRGIYVLYANDHKEEYKVTYIGVAGLGKTGGGGVRSRLKDHDANKDNWTHFSLFEVHDNITSDEIREIEELLLGIFRHDPNVDLYNKQKSSKAFYQLRHRSLWTR